MGLTPGQGAKILCASWPKKQNIKQKQYCNKSSKDFKNVPLQKLFKKNEKALPYFRVGKLRVWKLRGWKVGGIITPEAEDSLSTD